MIEEYFRSTRVRDRLAHSELGAVFEDLVEYLRTRGHPVSTIQQYVQAVEHFDGWLRRARVPTASIDEESVQRFLRKHIPRCQCPPPRCHTIPQTRAALAHLLLVLRQTGRVPSERRSDTPTDAVVAGFVTHLLDRRGAAASTAAARACYVHEFLAEEFGTDPIEVTRIDVAAATAFLVARRGRWCTGTMKAAATALRSFFRYLELERGGGGELVASVPTLPGWKLASVPRVLDETEVHAILNAFDRRTPIGRRSYASTMCLAYLGLRTCEVAALSLDDIDWRAGTVRVAATKSRRADVLPLPEPVARAILAYLRRGRPKTSIRQIFVRHAPPGASAGPGVVRNAVRLACAHAGLDPHIGPHALRHTVATRLLRRGASMKEIADVLRHRSIDTAAIYAKVDLGTLGEVAARWPGRIR